MRGRKFLPLPNMIRFLNTKDKVKFIEFCKEFKDKFYDNYITVDKERKFLTDPKISSLVFNNINKKGDKCFILEENEQIEALFIIVGFSDKFPRKYVKCLVDVEKYCNDLFMFLLWNFDEIELYMKIKNNSPIVNVANKYGFEFFKGRGQESLLIKRPNITRR